MQFPINLVTIWPAYLLSFRRYNYILVGNNEFYTQPVLNAPIQKPYTCGKLESRSYVVPGVEKMTIYWSVNTHSIRACSDGRTDFVQHRRACICWAILSASKTNTIAHVQGKRQPRRRDGFRSPKCMNLHSTSRSVTSMTTVTSVHMTRSSKVGVLRASVMNTHPVAQVAIILRYTPATKPFSNGLNV